MRMVSNSGPSPHHHSSNEAPWITSVSSVLDEQSLNSRFLFFFFFFRGGGVNKDKSTTCEPFFNVYCSKDAIKITHFHWSLWNHMQKRINNCDLSWGLQSREIYDFCFSWCAQSWLLRHHPHDSICWQRNASQITHWHQYKVPQCHEAPKSNNS